MLERIKKFLKNIFTDSNATQTVENKDFNSPKNHAVPLCQPLLENELYNIKDELKRKLLLMNCDIESATPIEILAAQNFIHGINQRNTTFLGSNDATLIETIIFTTYLLLSSTIAEFTPEFQFYILCNQFIHHTGLAISKYFNMDSHEIYDIVNNRFDIYNTCLQDNQMNVIELVYKFELLLSTDYLDEKIKMLPINIPICILDGFEKLELEKEIITYYSTIDDYFQPTISYIKNSLN